jgi:hypothetical protein
VLKEATVRSNRGTRAALFIVLLACTAITVTLVLCHQPKSPQFAGDVLAELGKPLAVAASAEFGRVKGGLFHNKELRLSGLHQYVGGEQPGMIWVYSTDGGVQLDIGSVLTGQFANVPGALPFAHSPSFRVRLIKFDEHGKVVEDKTSKAYFLLLETAQTGSDPAHVR